MLSSVRTKMYTIMLIKTYTKRPNNTILNINIKFHNFIFVWVGTFRRLCAQNIISLQKKKKKRAHFYMVRILYNICNVVCLATHTTLKQIVLDTKTRLHNVCVMCVWNVKAHFNSTIYIFYKTITFLYSYMFSFKDNKHDMCYETWTDWNIMWLFVFVCL